MKSALQTVEEAIWDEMKRDGDAHPIRLVVGDGAPKQWRRKVPNGAVNCIASKYGFLIPIAKRSGATILYWASGRKTMFSTI